MVAKPPGFKGSLQGLSSPLEFLADGELKFVSDDELINQWIWDAVLVAGNEWFGAEDGWPGLDDAVGQYDTQELMGLVIVFLPVRLQQYSDFITGISVTCTAEGHTVTATVGYQILRTGEKKSANFPLGGS